MQAQLKIRPIGLLAFAFAAASGAFVAAREQTASAAADVAASAEPIALVDQKTIDLGTAYPDNPAAAGRTFRARKITLAPGASTTATGADERPAIYYVTAGTIVERRGETSAPRALHEAGAIAKGEAVTLENGAAAPAEILIVDIIAGEE